MIIPFGGLFIHGKGANIPVLRAVVFTVVLKCYCFPKTGLSSFYSDGRGGLKGPGGAVGGAASGEVSVWLLEQAAGVWRGCGVFCISDLGKECSGLEL